MLFEINMKLSSCPWKLWCVCSCISAIVCLSCSKDNDYEIYAELRGTVTDYNSGLPLGNTSIVLSPSNHTVLTESDGTFIFKNLDAQQYTLTVQKSGYYPNRKAVTAVSGESTEVNIPLTQIEP